MCEHASDLSQQGLALIHSPYPEHHFTNSSISHKGMVGDWTLEDTDGAFPLHGTVRFGTARYGTVRLSSGRFAFPPQFSTAIQWAGLFTRRYNCAASTAVTSS